MFSHPIMLEMLAKEHQKSLLEEASRQRMINKIKKAYRSQPLKARFFIRVAEFLILTGFKIKEKYGPVMSQAASCGSTCRNGM